MALLGRQDRYIVVGGGIAGLTTAYMLSSLGFRVRVVEPGWSQLAASWAAAGIVTTLMPPPLASLALRSYNIVKSVEPDSIEMFRAYWISDGCKEIEEYNVENGIFKPGKPPSLMEGVDQVYVGRLPVVDTGLFLSSLESRLRSLSVGFNTSRAIALGKGFVETENSRLDGIPIVAAGPWSVQLLPLLKNAATVYRCQVLAVRGVPRNARKTVIIDDIIDFYAVCWNNECLVGDGNNDEIQSIDDGFTPDLSDLLDTVYRASERLPWLLEARISSYWAAPCIAALDAYPLVGPVDEDLLVITGFNGAGVTLAPASAEILAKSIAFNEKVPEILAAGRTVEPVEVWPPEPFRLC